jgi:transposase
MYLRPHSRSKDGKAHAYWSLVETVRTPDGPRQKSVCYLGELSISRGKLEARLDRTLSRNYRSPANRRLANHLQRERGAMFTFLYCPGLDATNYRAEQTIRPMVVTRKVWGGNRTERSAQAQSVLVSIPQTCRQQLRSATQILQQLLHLPKPQAMELIPTAPC